MKHIDKNVLTILAATTVSSSNLFIYCFFGKLATESYQKMADCLYESNWWELPVGLQKYFLLMNMNMQRWVVHSSIYFEYFAWKKYLVDRLLFYHGFEVAVLNLETFSQVSLIKRRKIRCFSVSILSIHFISSSSKP